MTLDQLISILGHFRNSQVDVPGKPPISPEEMGNAVVHLVCPLKDVACWIVKDSVVLVGRPNESFPGSPASIYINGGIGA